MDTSPSFTPRIMSRRYWNKRDKVAKKPERHGQGGVTVNKYERMCPCMTVDTGYRSTVYLTIFRAFIGKHFGLRANSLGIAGIGQRFLQGNVAATSIVLIGVRFDRHGERITVCLSASRCLEERAGRSARRLAATGKTELCRRVIPTFTAARHSWFILLFTRIEFCSKWPHRSSSTSRQ